MVSSSSSVKHGSAKPEGGGWALYGAFLAGYIVSRLFKIITREVCIGKKYMNYTTRTSSVHKS